MQKWNHYYTMLNCVIYTAPRCAYSATLPLLQRLQFFFLSKVEHLILRLIIIYLKHLR